MEIDVRQEIYQQAKEWVLKAGSIIRGLMNEKINIKTKCEKNDLVTNVDRAIELFLVTKIKRKYPNHLILSEEGYGNKAINSMGTVWIIDPIDGTRNLVNQKENFAISLAVIHQEVGEIGFVYDVMKEVIYSAKRNECAYRNDVKLKELEEKADLSEVFLSFNHELLCRSDEFNRDVIEEIINRVRAVRSKGSAALEIVQVIEGLSDGYIAKRLSPWDVAAGIVLLNEVNGIATSTNGNRLSFFEEGSIFVSNKGIHEKVVLNYLKRWKV